MSIRLIIFDLDGVLCDCKDLHYEALNRALAMIDPKYVIGREEHLSKYDGLNTTKKLKILMEDKGLPKEFQDEVWRHKQRKTIEIIREYTPDTRIIEVLHKLWSDGFTIAVASNSIRETVRLMLLKKGFMEFIHFFLSNQDVKNPKPNVEMYLECMIKAGVSPKETIIIEDSHIGRKAAIDSGAYLFAVNDSNGVQYQSIKNLADSLDGKEHKPKWQGQKMNVLIPCAGMGSRFLNAGYSFPKPLIAIKNFNDQPMIQVVVDNLNIDAKHIFIIRDEHNDKYNMKQLLNVISPKCDVITVNHLTDGAACTTLLAKELINNDQPLLIANSDQFVHWDSNEFMYSMMDSGIDGGILTFNNSHPKWSYVKQDVNGFVVEVKEKQVISNKATVGIYYWRKGSDYVKYAESMISKGKETQVNGEWFVAPTFNEAIADGKKIKIFNIDKMFGMGVPEDLEYFINNYKP